MWITYVNVNGKIHEIYFSVTGYNLDVTHGIHQLTVRQCWSRYTVTCVNDDPILLFYLIFVRSLSSWWRHQIETFSALLAICAGNSPVDGEFPAQGQWSGASMIFLICSWMDSWVNNVELGNLRRHRAHYDIRVMIPVQIHSRCLYQLVILQKLMPCKHDCYLIGC